jgi:uncharacterized protein YdeI (YjbR/CyaY-like superfamily)
MGKKDPRVDAYIAAAADFAQPILKHVRGLVHRGCPDVEETMKWSFPHFDHRGIMCGLAAFKSHCAFGFWKGKLVVDPKTNKSAEAMGQFGRITSLRDLPADATIVAMVREAARLNEEGIAVPRRRGAPKKEAVVPPDLAAALRAAKGARAAFDGFTPGKRRQYVEWLAEAKTEETRKRRLTTAVAWIAEGKSRNWKYERA